MCFISLLDVSQFNQSANQDSPLHICNHIFKFKHFVVVGGGSVVVVVVVVPGIKR